MFNTNFFLFLAEEHDSFANGLPFALKDAAAKRY